MLDPDCDLAIQMSLKDTPRFIVEMEILDSKIRNGGKKPLLAFRALPLADRVLLKRADFLLSERQTQK